MLEVERKIMQLLVEAHNQYIELEQTHPGDLPEWVNNIHNLQRILGTRILRRDYPEDFATIIKPLRKIPFVPSEDRTNLDIH